jgi:hypothetical protein
MTASRDQIWKAASPRAVNVNRGLCGQPSLDGQDERRVTLGANYMACPDLATPNRLLGATAAVPPASATWWGSQIRPKKCYLRDTQEGVPGNCPRSNRRLNVRPTTEPCHPRAGEYWVVSTCDIAQRGSPKYSHLGPDLSRADVFGTALGPGAFDGHSRRLDGIGPIPF